MGNKPYTLDRTIRLVIGIAVCITLFALTKRLSAVLLPFLVSWLIAYMLHPMVKFFQYKLKFKNRMLSVVTTLITVVAVLFGICLIVVPVVASEISKVHELATLYMTGIDANSILPAAWQNELHTFITKLNIETLLQNDNVVTGIKNIIPQVWNIIGNSVNFVMGITVIFDCLLYLFFILVDFEKIYVGWRSIIPPKYKEIILDIAHDLEEGMNRYFRGQALVAFLVGVLFSIGFCITGLPLAIPIGLFIGLLNMVPYLQIIGIVPCLILGILQSSETGTDYWIILIGIAAVFIVVQSIQDFVLVPKIMGEITGLNPAIILLSLSIWGSLLGIVGMIIALPMTTLIISYYKRLILHQKEEEK